MNGSALSENKTMNPEIGIEEEGQLLLKNYFLETLLSNKSEESLSCALKKAVESTNKVAEEKGLHQPFDTRSNFPDLYTSAQPLLGFQRKPGLMERQPIALSLIVACKCQGGKAIGFVRRVVREIRTITIGPASIAVELDTGRQLEDSCYIELDESNNRWRVAQCPSGIDLRKVKESELTPGCGDLIVVSGCIFKTDQATPEQELKPVEVPARSLGSLMRSLGFDIADKGKMYRVYAPRFARQRKSAVSIYPDVDHLGQNRFTAARDIQVDGHVLKACVQVWESEKISCIAHRLKAQYRSSLFTNAGRRAVSRKLKSRDHSLVLM